LTASSHPTGDDIADSEMRKIFPDEKKKEGHQLSGATKKKDGISGSHQSVQDSRGRKRGQGNKTNGLTTTKKGDLAQGTLVRRKSCCTVSILPRRIRSPSLQERFGTVPYQSGTRSGMKKEWLSFLSKESSTSAIGQRL